MDDTAQPKAKRLPPIGAVRITALEAFARRVVDGHIPIKDLQPAARASLDEAWRHYLEAEIATRPGAWEPEFAAHAAEQLRLVHEFCLEIAGRKGERGSPPDPVRLLEMAQALYQAERAAANLSPEPRPPTNEQVNTAAEIIHRADAMHRANAMNVLATFAHEVYTDAFKPEGLEGASRKALERAGLIRLGDVVALGTGQRAVASLAPQREPLPDDRIKAIVEGMPGGLDGFLKGWGWQQFARAIEAAHGIQGGEGWPAAPMPTP